jgi:hypothetical protein
MKKFIKLWPRQKLCLLSINYLTNWTLSWGAEAVNCLEVKNRELLLLVPS